MIIGLQDVFMVGFQSADGVVPLGNGGFQLANDSILFGDGLFVPVKIQIVFFTIEAHLADLFFGVELKNAFGSFFKIFICGCHLFDLLPGSGFE